MPPSSLEPPLAPGMTVPSGLPRPGLVEPPPPTDPADPPPPQVTIRVRVPALAQPGQELQYRLIVQNTSQSPAHQVRVRAPLPSNSILVRTDPEPSEREPEMIWKWTTLAGGASKEISLVVKPSGAGDLQCCARVQFEHGECVRTRLTQADLRVRFNAPSQAALNDIIKIQIEVTNAGQRDATGVVLTNSLSEDFVFVSGKSVKGENPLTWDLGTIAPGKSQRVEYEAMVARTGILVNKAEVKDAAGAKQETGFQVVVGEPKLTVAMVGPKTRIVGRATTYQINVSNPGTRPATNVEVLGEIPDKITFVSATLGGQLKGTAVRWKLGTLAPGAKQTMQLTVQAKEAVRLNNGVVVTADRGLSTRASAPTSFEGATGLSLEMDKNPDPVEVGKTGTYTLHVVNQGNAEATMLTLALTMPAELQVLEIKGGGKQDGQSIRFALEKLAPGGEATFIIKAQALRAGEVRLRSELTAKELTSGPIHFEESTTLYGDSPPAAGPKPPG